MKKQLLALYLNKMREKLVLAMAETESLMPEGAARKVRTEHYVKHDWDADSREMMRTGKTFLKCEDPNHYREVSDGRFLALEPLDRFLEEFDSDIAELR